MMETLFVVAIILAICVVIVNNIQTVKKLHENEEKNYHVTASVFFFTFFLGILLYGMWLLIETVIMK